VTSVSVVVPARNAGHTLGACLDALRKEGVPGEGVELFVVDDGSSDDTALVATRRGARVLPGEARGPAAARNLGARAASGEVLVFLDADTEPRPGWLKEMLAPFADPDVVAVKGRYYTRQRSPIAHFVQLEFEEKYDRLERAPRVDFVDSGTAAYRRDAFLAAGGFDEGFLLPSVEDVELAFRLATAGARFVFNPRASVWHSHADSLRDYLRKKAGYGYFRVRVYRRYPQKALGDSYTPPTMAVQIALAALTGLLGMAAALRVPSAARALVATMGVFALTTTPLARRAWRSDPGVAALVPVLVYARSWAQGLGILAGVIRLGATRALGAGHTPCSRRKSSGF
jgi:GT2 family glycosyltransferase